MMAQRDTWRLVSLYQMLNVSQQWMFGLRKSTLDKPSLSADADCNFRDQQPRDLPSCFSSNDILRSTIVIRLENVDKTLQDGHWGQ